MKISVKKFVQLKNLKKLPFATTQNQRLCNAFIAGESLTQEQARAKYNIKRLAARVYDLQDSAQGFYCLIESKPVIEDGISVACYKMSGRWC